MFKVRIGHFVWYC